MAGCEIATQTMIQDNTQSSLKEQNNKVHLEVYKLGSCPKSANPVDWNTSYEFSRTGKELRKTGRYSEAIDQYTNAINKCPQDPNHLLGRGNAYYEQAIQAEASGDTVVKRSSLHCAIQDLNKARSLHSHWKIPATSAKVYKSLGRFTDSLKAIEDSLYASNPFPTGLDKDILLESKAKIMQQISDQTNIK